MSAIDAIMPYEPQEIVLDLPFPPSVNVLWRPSRYGGMYLNPKYLRWIKNCDTHVMARKRRQKWRTIATPFEALILLNPDMGWGDVDNYIKAIMDYAQRIEVISNDKLCQQVTSRWGNSADAPCGCRLILREIDGNGQRVLDQRAHRSHDRTRRLRALGLTDRG